MLVFVGCTERHERCGPWKSLRQLLTLGLRTLVDEDGNMPIGHRSIPALRTPYPEEDETERRIARELRRRHGLDRDHG